MKVEKLVKRQGAGKPEYDWLAAFIDLCRIIKESSYVQFSPTQSLPYYISTLPGPNPPAHHPEPNQYIFSALATSTARAIFRLSRCKSSCPFATTLELSFVWTMVDPCEEDSDSGAGETDRGVDDIGEGEEDGQGE